MIADIYLVRTICVGMIGSALLYMVGHFIFKLLRWLLDCKDDSTKFIDYYFQEDENNGHID